MDSIDIIRQRIPDYARDLRLNLDAVLARSALPAEEALGCALAAAWAARSATLVEAIRASGRIGEAQANGALAAAAIMGMTNPWYTYVDLAADEDLKSLPAQLRMNVYATHGGVSRRSFEAYALAASVIGKCRHCIAAHVAALREEGLGATELRDIGRIAAVIGAVGKVLAIEAEVPVAA
jgi:alkyl hydroperoxide reductase subunit D